MQIAKIFFASLLRTTSIFTSDQRERAHREGRNRHGHGDRDQYEEYIVKVAQGAYMAAKVAHAAHEVFEVAKNEV